MGIPIRQQFTVARYVVAKTLRRAKRYPLVLMLEPLFRCNLTCAGCGKIDYPADVLKQRLSVDDCMKAIEECGAPVVSIAGGEPLLHKELPEIVRGFIQRKKYIYLCTNALLLERNIDDYTPSPFLNFSVHLDGNRERHDASVCQSGVFDIAEKAIKTIISKGFRATVNCTLFQGESPEEIADFLDYAMDLGVEGVTISAGFSYEHAPKQDVFLKRRDTKQMFRDVFRIGRSRKWSLSHSSLFLDFLAGNQTYRCTAWGNPTRNVFGWQRPCYLLVDEGHAPTYKALVEETTWDDFGTGINPKCANCTAHCGYEPTAVQDALKHPLKAFKVAIRGPRTEGPMAPEVAFEYSENESIPTAPSVRP